MAGQQLTQGSGPRPGYQTGGTYLGRMPNSSPGKFSLTAELFNTLPAILWDKLEQDTSVVGYGLNEAPQKDNVLGA